MPYLVRSLDTDVAARLERAYVALANAWLSSAPRPPSAASTSWRELAASVAEAQIDIDLSPAHWACDDVDGGRWSRVEVFNSLRHMEVLLGATTILDDLAAELTWCAPTQQHLDTSDADTMRADLEGENTDGTTFIVEAYGGVRYRNNSKLALDMRSVMTRAAAMPGQPRLYLAARSDVLRSPRTGALGRSWQAGATLQSSCSKKHGGPFRIAADVVAVTGDAPSLEGATYAVIELERPRLV